MDVGEKSVTNRDGLRRTSPRGTSGPRRPGGSGKEKSVKRRREGSGLARGQTGGKIGRQAA